LNSFVDFREIRDGCNAIQGDLDAVILNPMPSIVLKLLRLNFQIFSLAQQWFGVGNQGASLTKGSEIILKY
jgi:hypothetical protein